MSSIYVIEDEKDIADVLTLNLTAAGHTVSVARNGQDVLEALYAGQHYDLAVVDIMLPGVSGSNLLKPLTERGIPVIFLTAVADIDTKVSGLLGGAEDYMTKPFDVRELLARVAKVLRRTGRDRDRLQVGPVTLHLSSRRAFRDAKMIDLTPLEFDLLAYLMRNPGTVLSRDQILANVWGALFEGETRTVDVHISQLRAKTGLEIQAVPKIGYRLEAQP